MKGKITNYYNVIKDGELIAQNVKGQEAAVLSSCSQGRVSTYANKGKPYHSADGSVYKFNICFVSETVPKPVIERPIFVDKITNKSPEDFEKDWDEMLEAVKLLKTGRGKIVNKYIKGKYARYVEAIG